MQASYMVVSGNNFFQLPVFAFGSMMLDVKEFRKPLDLDRE